MYSPLILLWIKTALGVIISPSGAVTVIAFTALIGSVSIIIPSIITNIIKCPTRFFTKEQSLPSLSEVV